jgi:hypothetical protein
MIENADVMRKLTMYGGVSTDLDEGFRVILESESWRFVSTKVHIGLHNKCGIPRDFTIKITELKDIEMLPKELGEKYTIFDKIFKREDATQVS